MGRTAWLTEVVVMTATQTQSVLEGALAAGELTAGVSMGTEHGTGCMSYIMHPVPLKWPKHYYGYGVHEKEKEI